MKKYMFTIVALLLLNLSAVAQHKDWGIGIRVGDPSGITAKKYLGHHHALEFSLGRSGVWSYNYKNAFYRYDSFDERYYDYRWHRLRSALSFQVHYLTHRSLDQQGFKGLEWYYGLGGQLRAFVVDYEYKYYFVPGQKNGEIRHDSLTDLDLGVDGTIGLEYSWREMPVTVFTDLNLFMEIADNPFLFFMQGGVGARYYF